MKLNNANLFLFLSNLSAFLLARNKFGGSALGGSTSANIGCHYSRRVISCACARQFCSHKLHIAIEILGLFPNIRREIFRNEIRRYSLLLVSV